MNKKFNMAKMNKQPPSEEAEPDDCHLCLPRRNKHHFKMRFQVS
jgi:hypothetical protein